ncbi:biotin--[acetyl-CoA-carboxylase] ligase [Dolosicoccus paucivorans]|uniref:biotin--[acetyl-CoA-carboxylase] ligase n=1 Tax=Dolosicoccus paucivorans TaxID=84521 RepID=UPI0008849562|nr:biotin--[acetyl-CoA-carboxylase] ligase [Dolosicoccus paucivorans]SDI51096.1 BirA family transcriptional regulator, biotin operon repressor / biotin-[acetyl-CoA-carboxylase] ligase [Dolosicoccus paucivorans]
MTITDQILMTLIERKEQPISGQDLANHLSITRNTVWNHIKQLKENGYEINSQPGQGYILTELSPHLDATQLKYLLKRTFNALHIEVLPTTTSTNDIAKAYQADHPTQPALFVTQNQTKGRGRYGKSFKSDLDEGLYLSLVIPPSTTNFEEMTRYTLMAAVAVVEALKPWVEDDLAIKWVNDIFYNGKKIAGILCESIMSLENYEPQAVVIGIGINLAGSFTKDKELKEIAGTVFDTHLPNGFNLNQLIATLIKKIEGFHLSKDPQPLIEKYDHYLLGKGQKVTYQQQNSTYQGVLKGIDSNGQLLIQRNGKTETLIAGEVTFNSAQFAKEN